MGPTWDDQWRRKLEAHGLRNFGEVHWNATTGELYEHAVRRREGLIAHLGALCVRTGHHTGRSPNDKFIVKEPTSQDNIWWDNNVSFSQEQFDRLLARQLAYAQGKDLFVQDCFVCAHPEHRMPIRVITEDAWSSLLARNLFLRIFDTEELMNHEPAFTMLHMPHFHSIAEEDGTRSESFIILNFEKRLAIIGGTSYGGEIKKSMFTILNYLLPEKGVLPMHCSANMGREGDVALFFGLSGTGKTTLSADPKRMLIGDDEHGWADDGIFNFEGGCYAKVIKLSAEKEPQIYSCTRRFGTLMENVAIDRLTRRVDLDDDSFTENTRAAYPIGYIPNAVENGRGGHPNHVIFLTCDAFGVMPPVAKLTPEQAMFHFVSGYTARVAGTEKGLTEPASTFSPCFGAPFLPRHPSVYAKMLGEKLAKHDTQCWLVNTGWSGGPFGVGARMDIHLTREIVDAALSGKLADGEYVEDPVFHIGIPKHCPGVPDEVLFPRNTWPDPEAYDVRAQKLANDFSAHFDKAYGNKGIDAAIVAQCPGK